MYHNQPNHTYTDHNKCAIIEVLIIIYVQSLKFSGKLYLSKTKANHDSQGISIRYVHLILFFLINKSSANIINKKGRNKNSVSHDIQEVNRKKPSQTQRKATKNTYQPNKNNLENAQKNSYKRILPQIQKTSPKRKQAYKGMLLAWDRRRAYLQRLYDFSPSRLPK